MAQAAPSQQGIAYRGLSIALLAAFLYFWIFTLSSIFLRSTVQKITPRQAGLYKTFLRQEWHLFAIPKLYNRQFNLIIKNRNNATLADTIDLVQYSITQKRAHAPFNSYQAVMDRSMYWVMNRFEDELGKKKKQLKQQEPGLPDSNYVQQASAIIVADTAKNLHFKNIVAFATYMLRQEQKDTTGKIFEMEMLYKYIPPTTPPAKSYTSMGRQIIFKTTLNQLATQ